MIYSKGISNRFKAFAVAVDFDPSVILQFGEIVGL